MQRQRKRSPNTKGRNFSSRVFFVCAVADAFFVAFQREWKVCPFLCGISVENTAQIAEKPGSSEGQSP